MLRSREKLLMAIAQRLTDHVPLLPDSEHSAFLVACCRLLHNLSVGASAELDTRFLARVLNGCGAILDAPSHGPELRAICVALVGKLLPNCPPKQICDWCAQKQVKQVSNSNCRQPLISFYDTEEEHSRDLEKDPHDFTVPDRCQLLISCLDHLNAPLLRRSTSGAGQISPRLNKTERQNEAKKSMLLHGSLKALASIVPNVESVRFAIGDERRRCRKLVKLLRARKLEDEEEEESNEEANRSKCLGPATPQHDFILAGNVCLVLMNCIADTPLAEHLLGTNAIQDLLMLIQNSENQCRSNAAILASRLAMANQEHREEIQRLDGWGILNRACGYLHQKPSIASMFAQRRI
ncbi:Tetratricopeptide repeat protein 12 [Cichlidogyrus casuarinus]|uniref:Tetratricopeptide repeat protein 12 n=1 Tax=Cichlidogyrus casuarinus TaxID=1844966 RepID=A0ABD2QGQ4_9PLAT